MGHFVDFSIIDWKAFAELAVAIKREGFGNEPSNETELEDYLWKWKQKLQDEGRLIRFHDLTRYHSLADDIGPLSALGATYSIIRPCLPMIEREKYDSIYLPFISPWVQGFENQPVVCDLNEDKKLLGRFGLGWVLSPDRCSQMAAAFCIYSFSRLIHIVFAHGSVLPPKKDKYCFFHDLIDETNDISMPRLHAAYTEITDGWRIATDEARKRKWGIIV